jgi:hypothetical protein
LCGRRRSGFEVGIPKSWIAAAASRKIDASVGGDFKDQAMVALLLMVFAMFIWCEVVSDVSTREVVSFAISASWTSSGSEVLLPKLEISGSRPGQLLEVDRSGLDAWVVPDPA